MKSILQSFRKDLSIEILINEVPNRNRFENVGKDGKLITLPLFYTGERISGDVIIAPKHCNSLEHHGVKIELVEEFRFLDSMLGRQSDIVCKTYLARKGTVSREYTFPFELNYEKQIDETYMGLAISFSYFLRVTVPLRSTDKTSDVEVAIIAPPKRWDTDPGILLDAKIAKSICLQFKADRSNYHLNDVIEGTIIFTTMRLRTKKMDVKLVKRENFIQGTSVHEEMVSVGSFEVLDGSPFCGQLIPVRMYLSTFYLSPSIKHPNRNLTLQYFLQIDVQDEEDRRYTKRQEIILHRYPNKTFLAHAQANADTKPFSNLMDGSSEGEMDTALKLTPSTSHTFMNNEKEVTEMKIEESTLGDKSTKENSVDKQLHEISL